MPWCEDCNRFWNPPSMGAGGECPTCGRVLTQVTGAPWHFKLLVVAVDIRNGDVKAMTTLRRAPERAGRPRFSSAGMFGVTARPPRHMRGGQSAEASSDATIR